MQEIEKIRKASVGKETREPIASVLEKTYENMCNKEYINQEVVDARANHLTLNDRLNDIESKIGNLKLLKTKHKNSIEEAINELAKKVNITVESKWKTLASMPTARSGMSSVVVGNKIYCIGGITSDGSASGVIESYDVLKDCWNIEASLQNKRAYAMSEVIDDKIYIIGGYDGNETLKSVECYDIKTKTVTTKADMPYKNGSKKSYINNGLIHVIGGLDSYALQIYNPNTDAWSTKFTVPATRWYVDSVLVDNKMFFFGGNYKFTAPYPGARTFEYYDILSETLTQKIDMNNYKTHLGCANIGDYIYLIGGVYDENISDIIKRYNYKKDTWKTFEMKMTEARADFVCEVVNNKIYCIGGTNNKNNIVATNEVLIVR